MQQTRENKTTYDYGDCSTNQISSEKQVCRSSGLYKQVCRSSGLYYLRVLGERATETNEQKLKQAEESLRTVMYLSCWGPNT